MVISWFSFKRRGGSSTDAIVDDIIRAEIRNLLVISDLKLLDSVTSKLDFFRLGMVRVIYSSVRFLLVLKSLSSNISHAMLPVVSPFP